MKNNIEKLGFHFAKQLKGVDSKLENLKENPTQDEFIDFVNEETDWNTCDCCGKIDNSSNLLCIEERENLFDDDYVMAKFMNEALDPCVQTLCFKCFDNFKEMTFLSLETINNRLTANNLIYDVGDKVYVIDKQHPLSSKVVTISEVVEQYFYKIEDCAIHLKDDMLFDMVNYALTEEFVNVVDKYTDRIDDYDEFTGAISSADLTCCFEEFGLKNEFRKYLNENGFEQFLDNIQ